LSAGAPLTTLPQIPSSILGGLLLRRRGRTRGEGRGGERRVEKGRRGKGKGERGREGTGEGKDGKGGARSAPKLKLAPPELFSWRRRCLAGMSADILHICPQQSSRRSLVPFSSFRCVYATRPYHWRPCL